MAAQTVGDWARRAATLPAVFVDSTPPAVRAAGEVLEQAARVNLLQATGGDSKLSRVRSGKGASIKLAVKVQGAGSRARALVVPTGPIMLIEDRTKPHRSPFRHAGTTGAGGRRRYATAGEQLANGGIARRRRAQRRGFVFIPGVGVRASAKHPGTRGKRPIGKAFDSHSSEAGEVGLTVFATAARRHLSRG